MTSFLVLGIALAPAAILLSGLLALRGDVMKRPGMKAGFAAIVMSLAMGAAWADTGLDRLKSDLSGTRSATQVLTQWCADRKLASPAVIRAEKIPGPGALSDARVRALLKVAPGEIIRHRRVRLMCGRHLMSEADNWYLPARLTPAMNRQLDTTDTSFGTVVRPLDFHRRTLETRTLTDSHLALRIEAVLIAGGAGAFSLVVEDYSRDLVRP